MNTFVPKSTTENQQPKPDRKRPSSRDGLSAATAASLDSALFDNRPQAIAQRKLQAMAEQGPRVQHLTQLQAMVDTSPRQVAQRKQLQQSFGRPVQRQQGPEEEELQMKAAPGTVQRQSLEDEELLQGKMDPVQRQGLEDEELVQGRFAGSEPPMQRQGVADGGENRTGMPDSLKGGLEQLSGMDLSGVRVHHNSAKPAQLNALAYAQGQDIHLGPGQEQHLPHEGWHAVQQMQGRVKPTIQAQGVSINDDEGLEREADVMGATAWQTTTPCEISPSTASPSPSASLGQTVQRTTWNWSEVRPHVVLGDYTGRKEHPTGYHWENGSSGFNTYGRVTNRQTVGVNTDNGVVTNADQIYEKSVVAPQKGKKGKKAYIVKFKQSTFFPDTCGGHATNEEDIKEAVNLASKAKNDCVNSAYLQINMKSQMKGGKRGKGLRATGKILPQTRDKWKKFHGWEGMKIEGGGPTAYPEGGGDLVREGLDALGEPYVNKTKDSKN